MLFKNKKVLITGASKGIGRATALAFAKEGAELILVARSKDDLEILSKELSTLHCSHHIFCLDLIKTENIDRLFGEIEYADVSVNNAATEGALGPITSLRLKDYDACLDLNLKSVWYCLKKEIEGLISQKKSGTIVNVSSIAGLIGLPESSLYVASKHAINGLTKSLAIEQIKNGIRINTICPGPIETNMLSRVVEGDLLSTAKANPTGRNGRPEEVAQGILWLASEASSYVVGHCMSVDGGETAT